MQKDFDTWNKKKKLEYQTGRRFFREGEIWWSHIGLHVGYEIDGKGSDYSRPVLVLKKYNKYSFLVLPLTTKQKSNKYSVCIQRNDGKVVWGIASQVKNVDGKRLINRIGRLSMGDLAMVKKKISRINFC